MAGLRVVFAIDMMGQGSEIGEMLRLAIETCLAKTTLRPAVLAPRFRPDFQNWLEARKVTCIQVQTPLMPDIEAANRNSGYPLQAAGNYLRYEACSIFDDEMILYADCDVMFMRDVPQLSKPVLVAAGPQDRPDDFSQINSGVLLFNVAAFAAVLPGFYAFAGANLERLYPGFDQPAVNDYFVGRIEALPLELNWRPYWGEREDAVILHWHGLKLSLAERMLDGIYLGPPERRDLVIGIVEQSLSHADFFLKQISAEAVSENDYFRRLSHLNERIVALKQKPVDAYCRGVLRMRDEANTRLDEIRRRGIEFAVRMAGPSAICQARFDVGDAQNVRVVFSSLTAFLGISDLYEDMAGPVAARIRSATTDNVVLREDIHVSDVSFAFIDVIDETKLVDVIFHLTPKEKQGGRKLQLKIFGHSNLRIKIYLSTTEPFSESWAFWVFAQA